MKLSVLLIAAGIIAFAFLINYAAFYFITPLLAGILGATAALFWVIVIYKTGEMPTQKEIFEKRRKSADTSL